MELHYACTRSEDEACAGGSNPRGLQRGSSWEPHSRGTSSHHALARSGQPTHQFQTKPVEVTVGPTNSPCPPPAQLALMS